MRVPVPAQTDLRLLVFAAAVSMGTAIVFGSVPAWQSVRASLGTSLARRNTMIDRRAHLISPALVVAQVAVSLVLLMGAGLFLRTLTNLREVDLGFVPERLVVLDVNPRAAGYSIEQSAAVSHRILERLRALPGVTSASFSENGVMFGRDSSTNLIRPEGFAPAADGFPRAQWDVVGSGYFSTMGIALAAGRDFGDRDDESSPSVAAINEAMARQFFAGTNPIGRRLLWGGDNQVGLEVIAVVRDVKHGSPRDVSHLRFYLPYRQLSKTRPSWDLASVQFFVRIRDDSDATRRLLATSVTAEDPRLSIESMRNGPELVERSLVQERMIATLSIAFSLLGVGLACIGLYGLIAYHVAQRTSEIGVRMALGASPAGVLWATIRRALVWTAGGILLGIPIALGASRLAESLLYGLSPRDTTTLAGAAILLIAFGLAAAYIPARRAANIDPLTALRYE
jgi:predicted permease